MCVAAPTRAWFAGIVIAIGTRDDVLLGANSRSRRFHHQLGRQDPAIPADARCMGLLDWNPRCPSPIWALVIGAMLITMALLGTLLEATAAESRHPLSGHRLCAGAGRMGAHGARPAPLLRRPGKDGGSRAAHLAVRRRAEARRSAARQALVPAAAPGIPVDGADGGVRRGHRRIPARTARGRGDPARRDSGAHRSRARVGRAGRGLRRIAIASASA